MAISKFSNFRSLPLSSLAKNRDAATKNIELNDAARVNPKTVDTIPAKPSGPPLPGPSGKALAAQADANAQWKSQVGSNPAVQPSVAKQLPDGTLAIKKGGMIRKKKASGKAYSSGGKVGSASKRADGIAQRGKTKGKVV